MCTTIIEVKQKKKTDDTQHNTTFTKQMTKKEEKNCNFNQDHMRELTISSSNSLNI